MSLNIIIIITFSVSLLILLWIILISWKEYKVTHEKRIKFHKYYIYYQTDLDKNYNIIKVQKKIIIKLKFKLFLLKILKKLGAQK